MTRAFMAADIYPVFIRGCDDFRLLLVGPLLGFVDRGLGEVGGAFSVISVVVMDLSV
jgi:hypothetical protein